MPNSASAAPVTEVAADIERHVQHALDGLQNADVRANAHWLPGLATLLVQVERLERAAAAELLERVATDRSVLADVFNAGHDPGGLVQVQLGLSDPHNGRRTVALLRFANGPDLIYKPRPVTMEAAFSRLVDWIALIGPDLASRAPSTLERAGYGYCRHIAPKPCAFMQDVERFYLRLGALARLLAELRATDCHPGNVVAAIATGRCWSMRRHCSTRSWTQPRPIPCSATEILPSTVTTSRGQRVVYGGFDMAVAGSVGRPHLHGSAQPLAEYRSCFDDGVRQMGILLARTDQDIDAPDGPLRLAPTSRSRVVLRPTEMYGRLLGHGVSALALAAQDRGWPTAERLLHRFEDASLRPGDWAAVRASELAALQRRDIPYFLVEIGTGDLLDGCGNRLAAGVFPAPGGPTARGPGSVCGNPG